ncbi:3-oxoacyl-ACP synthase III family protein [Roseivirga sp. BDSF3-8]|uniref:3-oxoacyl-ACP synthase III family protein n=1 Tax=Roseivirga sp. BDSF3-8 TaxID=3241598 RepID=UPI003531F9D8
MYIDAMASYVPQEVVPNAYFEQVAGLTNDWIVERTGIRERRKAGEGENTNTMGVKAVETGLDLISFSPDKIDLIVGATYTPHDTIVTLAHAIQHRLDIHDVPSFSVSSACSSLVNAVEIVEGYFAMNKATHAVVVVSDHNTAYSNDEDPKSGPLWGDGAAALFITKEKHHDRAIRITDVLTGGAATRGKATQAITLRPLAGFDMPFGKDVFIHACQYMPSATNDLLKRNGKTVEDIRFLIPHQANLRITKNVMETLKLPEEKALGNIQIRGNTGCAGCGIVLDENKDRYQPGDLIVITVFGGGYSYGAMLLEV